MAFHFAAGTPVFPDDLSPDDDGLVAVGGDLEVPTLVEAYQKGIFPWTGELPIPWFSPDPRLVLFPTRLHVSRSLRRLLRRGHFTTRFDHDFPATIASCARAPRPDQRGTWITPNMIAAYSELHRLGIAHSVEVYRDGALAGGLYGLTFGRGFFGESMFARQSNASKVALVTLCQRLRDRGYHFIDCQQATPHLVSLGATLIPRAEYLERLQRALAFASEHEPWGNRHEFK